MILDEEILELVKYHFKEGGIRDDGSCSEYYGTTEDFIEFAKKIYQIGYDDGCYETSHFTGYTGLFGEPQ